MTHRVEGVVKDEGGEIIAYQLENHEVIVKDEAVKMVKNGEIQGVMVAKSKKGEEYLRSAADGEKSNNLSNLPVITEN